MVSAAFNNHCWIFALPSSVIASSNDIPRPEAAMPTTAGGRKLSAERGTVAESTDLASPAFDLLPPADFPLVFAVAAFFAAGFFC